MAEHSSLSAEPMATIDFLRVIFEFIADVLNAVAWPVAVVVVAVVFRKELKGIAGNLRKIKVGNTEAIFENLDKANSDAKALDPVDPMTASENAPRVAQLIELAKISPSGAILEAYKDVEMAIGQLHEHAVDAEMFSLSKSPHASSKLRRLPVTRSYQMLNEIGWLSKSEIRMLEALRETRNRAAHSRSDDISLLISNEFIRLADTLTDSLRSKLKEKVDDTQSSSDFQSGS